MAAPARNVRSHRKSLKKAGRLCAVVCVLALGPWSQAALYAQDTMPDLTTLRLEDLMNLDVTSASKRTQKISRVPAAIFVISSEDIRRSGATSLPELLRMAPGLDVAQINPSTWAISARGFNTEYSNKLLVLVDGRTIYNWMFSGIYWDAQDVPIDSIERIEIIRGPGAAVWGANAVNGVINILTRNAQDTKGGFASASGGTLDRGSGTIRYGGPLGSKGAYRLFADSSSLRSWVTTDKQNGHDGAYVLHAGFRTDSNLSAKDSLTTEGEALRGKDGEQATTVVSLLPPVNATLNLQNHFSEWNVLTRWNRVTPAGAETNLQVYFDRVCRMDTTLGAQLNTFDIDLHHHSTWRKRQELVWGVGYRLRSDAVPTTLRLSLTPPAQTSAVFNSFLQDEIALQPGRLYVSLGAKLEHEPYNGFNLQPTARITWTPDDRDTLWAAVSGAQRTPSRIENAVRYNFTVFPGPGGLPILLSVFGNPEQKNEHVTATEAGFRKQVSNRLSFDSSLFFNQYHDLASNEPGAEQLETSPAPLHLLIPSYYRNLLNGETHGIEIFANTRMARRWTLSPGYSFLAVHLHADPASRDTTSIPLTEGSAPVQQAQLKLQANLPWHFQSTTSAYFVGRLVAPQIPSYTRLDSKLTWQPSDRFSLDLVGQNLLQDLHQEYMGPETTTATNLIRRSAYGKITWWF